MADNSIDINIKARADKEEVEDLSQAIEKLTTEEKNVEITVNTDDSSVDEAESSVEDLDDATQSASESVDDLSSSINDVDSSPIDDTADSAQTADESLNSASDSAESLGVSITNIDPSVLEQLADASKNASDSMNDTEESSMSMVDAMASATLSAGITSGFMSASNAAGDYQDTMVRLGYAMTGTSMTVEQAEQRFGDLITTMSEKTGRGAGDVRSHLTNMANAGITNQQILQDSFEGVSKASFQMGESMDSLEMKFQAMALTGMAGKKQLKSFGLEVGDLAQVMGVSVDEVTDKFKEMDADSRASILSTALNMKYGSEVTQNYKNSYEHLNEELIRAKDYFIRVAGEALLPVLIPAIQSAADFINTMAIAFTALPGPIKSIIGGSTGLVVGFTAVGLAISSVVKIVNSAISPFIKLFNLLTGSNVKSVLEFASAMKKVAVEVLKAGYNALKSAGMWVVEKASKIASSIANGVLTASQWLLNIAMSANPIYLVVIAIIALITVLGYLYFNNEQVRNSINALGDAFISAGQIIYNSVLGFVDWVMTSLQGLYDYIMTFGGLLDSNVSITGNNIVDSILSTVAFIATLPLQLAVIFTNIIAKTLGFGDNFVQNIIKSAVNSVNGFMSYISTLPGRFLSELNKMLGYARDFLVNLPATLKNAAINVVKGWIFGTGEHSPGFMYDAFTGELTEMVNVVPKYSGDLNTNMKKLGSSVVDSFDNPDFDLAINGEIANNLVNTSNGNDYGAFRDIIINVGSVDKKERVDEIIDAVKDYFMWNNTTAGRTV